MNVPLPRLTSLPSLSIKLRRHETMVATEPASFAQICSGQSISWRKTSDEDVDERNRDVLC